MKIVRVISEHKKKSKLGMVEAVVRLKDGLLVTRHIFPADVDKAEPTPEQA
jgi:hypothetical protein